MSDKHAPKFDYHLKKKEQASVEKYVPMTQAKIHMALRANIEINKKKSYQEGAVALSEHYIILLKKKMIGKAYKPLMFIHILDVLMASTRNDNTFQLETHKADIVIITPIAIRLARSFMKNYMISCNSVSPKYRLPFKAHDATQFPKFEAKMSPSQSFQFSYNAHCTCHKANYVHEIVQYYHSLMINEVGIFDFNQLPLTATDDMFHQATNIRTVIGALEFNDLIFGVAADNLTRPDIYTNIAPLLSKNNNLRIFSVRKCYAETGLFQIAEHMKRNKQLNVSYWDISDNNFQDISYFIERFETYPNEVFYMNLNNTNMSENDVQSLCLYIFSNEKLWSIRYLHMKFGPFNDKAAHSLGDHIQNPKCRLKSLTITGKGANLFIKLLSKCNYKLEALSVRRSKLTPEAINDLANFISASTSFRELDLSNTDISAKQVVQIVNAFSGNRNLRGITLKLDHLDLRQRNLKHVIDALRASDLSKWVSLSLNKNDMKGDDLHDVVDLAKNMANIVDLSIDGPLKDADVAPLMSIKSLQNLRFRGSNNIYPLLDALPKNKTLKCLNVKHIPFGNDGYTRLAGCLNTNKGLQIIRTDFNGPKDLSPLLNYLNAIIESDQIVDVTFPMYDASVLIDKADPKDQKSFLKSIIDKQIAAQIKVNRNLLTVGMNSKLNVKRLPELDNFMTTLGVEFQSKLSRLNPTTHSALTTVLDLPLPYQNSNEKFENGGEIKKGNSTASTEVVENLDSVGQYQTLQFNSLIIKRPGQRQQTAVDQLFNTGKASAFAMDSNLDSMLDSAGNPMNEPSKFQPSSMDDDAPPDLSNAKIVGGGAPKKSGKKSGKKTKKIQNDVIKPPPPPPSPPNPLGVPAPPSIPGA